LERLFLKNKLYATGEDFVTAFAIIITCGSKDTITLIAVLHARGCHNSGSK
jgi:hypothetical protein